MAKRVLIVGAAGGLGRVVAARMLALGYTVFASVLDADEEAGLRREIQGIAGVFHADLSQSAAFPARIAQICDEIGELDAVTVCAAISPYGPVETYPVDQFRRTMEINFFSHIAIYQAALPLLRRNGGRVVFTSSMAGVVAMPFIGAYVATKFALEGIADVMRMEAAPQGVKVVLVEPGGIKTPMVSQQLRTLAPDLEALGDEESARYGYLYRGFRVLAEKSHYGEASTPEQIAEVFVEALTVAEPKARYVAGDDARQVIDMGRTASDAEIDSIYINAMADAGVG